MKMTPNTAAITAEALPSHPPNRMRPAARGDMRLPRRPNTSLNTGRTRVIRINTTATIMTNSIAG